MATATVPARLLSLPAPRGLSPHLAGRAAHAASTSGRLTEGACQRLLARARHHPRDLAILTLFLHTGIRRGELAGLLLMDIALPLRELRTGTLQVRRGSARTIPLDAPTCQALGRYLTSRPASGDPHLFLSTFRHGFGSWGVEDVAIKYLCAAGITGASPHSLRHTFAIQQVTRGVGLPTLQVILGHEHPATTRGYAALTRELGMHR